MCRHLALHSATKVPLTPYLEQSTGNSNGLFHRLRAPNPLLPLVAVLGGSPHAPSRAHCQGTPVLPTPPSTISRHRSARGWPAFRQQAAAGRLPRGEVPVVYTTPLNVCSPSPQYSPIRHFRVLPQPLPLATLPSPILRCLSRPRDAAQWPRPGHSGGVRSRGGREKRFKFPIRT